MRRNEIRPSQMEHGIGHKTLLHGIAYFQDNPCAAECLIRQISECGARIQILRASGPITNVFELQIPSKSQRKTCRIVTQNGDELDIAFEQDAAQYGDTLEQRVFRLEGEIAALKKLVRSFQKTHLTEVA